MASVISSCTQLFPQHQVKFQRGPLPLYEGSIEAGEQVTINRLGVLLGMGYVFSDFFAQGLSFGLDAFFLHLVASGKLNAGNFRVPLTRPSSLDDVRLLAPLWKTPKEKEALIRRFINVFKPNPSYVAEMQRLKGLHEATLARYATQDAKFRPPPPATVPTPSSIPTPLPTHKPSALSPAATPSPPVLIPKPLRRQRMSPMEDSLASLSLFLPAQFNFQFGDCFFNALSDLISPGQPTRHSRSLRETMANWLSNAVLGDDWASWAPILHHLSTTPGPRAPSSLSAYLTSLNRPYGEGGAWADNIAGRIACKALRINMSIFTYNSATGDVHLALDLTLWPDDAPRAKLLFTGSIYEGHYQPLRPSQDSDAAPLAFLAGHLNDYAGPFSLQDSMGLWLSREHFPMMRSLVWEFMRHESPYNSTAVKDGTEEVMDFVRGAEMPPGAEIMPSPSNKRCKHA